jgi:hypothetical protein
MEMNGQQGMYHPILNFSRESTQGDAYLLILL